MRSAFFIPAFLFLSCSPTQGTLEVTGRTALKEISGIAYTDSGLLWAIEDSGNDNKLYVLDGNGKTVRAVKITNAENKDWEDLASDDEGNLYIGDFGNNGNQRDDLCIYKVEKKDLEGKEAKASSLIRFYYPEQTKFPPAKSGRLFDLEAFFIHKSSFYLFTKNGSSPFDGTLYVYKVPNREGNHKAELLGTLKTCAKRKRCAVTAAAMSPDGTRAVLLTSDKIVTLTGFGYDNFAESAVEVTELGHFSQKESICFKDNSTLVIADERQLLRGGKVYELKLPAAKAPLKSE